MKTKFHLALPVKNIKETKKFYADFLGCSLGRSTETWLDVDFFGHQLTLQLSPNYEIDFKPDKQGVPLPHFGVVLPWKDWHETRDKWLEAKVKFLIPPRMVFGGQVGEQVSMILSDPNGYAVEFKSFQNEENVFKSK